MSDDSRPPTGKLARAQIVGSAALGAGMTRLRYFITRRARARSRTK